MRGRRAVVIGAGPAGLKAAHTLVKAGLEVTLLESGPLVGGLASSFDVQGTRIERYYHFICHGDDHLVDTLAELGLEGRLRWRDSRMAYFVDGTLYPFLTPLELLRFRPLRLRDRLRAGAAVKWAQRMKEEDLAPQKATLWLHRLFGPDAYQVIWEPLMRFKFAEHADEVSAAWIWARMVRLSRSRVSAWREELGYLQGGSQVVLEGLGRDFEARGGRLVLSAPVEQIALEGGRAVGVRVGGEMLPADAVISTVTTSRFRQLARGLDGEYIRRLERIPTIGIFCLFLRLTERVTPFFWVNTHDRRVPFDRSWIKFSAVFRDRFAQPICLTDYRTTTPGYATPAANLFLTDSCQLHPHDRSISGAFGLGLDAARLALLEAERQAATGP